MQDKYCYSMNRKNFTGTFYTRVEAIEEEK